MLALRLACRDLRGSMGGFRLLVAGIALGTAAITIVGSLSATILDGVRDGARASIGGDVSLRLFHQPPATEHLAAFDAAGTASLSAELRPLAHHAGHSALVEMKAVDEAYPLYGSLTLAPAITPAAALGRHDELWGAAVADSLLTSLDASLGDIVTVDGQRFELRALIVSEPDRAMRAFTLGPRMIVALPAVNGTDLVAPGAQVYWYSRIRLDPGRTAADWIAGFERAFPDAGFRIVDATDGVPGVERSLALITTLLTFAAMGILLIGGIGVGSAVSAYLDRKRDTIAILKSLGAPPPLILRLYLAQLLGATAVAVAIGLAAGGLASAAAVPLLAEWLPVEGRIRPRPLIVAGCFGLLATLLFALRPLARAAAQSPQTLFRQTVARIPDQPAVRQRAITLLVSALLALLLVWSAPLPVIAAIFAAAAAAVTLAFLVLGRIVAWAASRVGHIRRIGWPLLRLALANLHRPGAPTAPLVMALGLSLTLMVAIAALRENAGRHLATTLPETAPDLVVLNISPGEGARFDRTVADIPGVTRWQRVPFLHARISRIAGQPVAERHIPRDVAFVVRGDRGLSWRAEPPDGIVAGTWWDPGYDGPPLISLDEAAARRLGVTVGDSMTLTVLGTPLRAEIANLRTVDWSGLTLDFPILLSPPREPPPHREIAALWVAPQAVAPVRTRLAEVFPDAPTVLVGEVIAFLAAVATGVGAMLTAAAAATGFAALIVLAGAVAISQRRRDREAVLLKILGATRGQVLTAAAVEFGLLGTAAALAALVIGTLGAWAVVHGFTDFRPALGTTLPWAALALAVMAGTGLATAWRALTLPVGRVLRQD